MAKPTRLTLLFFLSLIGSFKAKAEENPFREFFDSDNFELAKEKFLTGDTLLFIFFVFWIGYVCLFVKENTTRKE